MTLKVLLQVSELASLLYINSKRRHAGQRAWMDGDVFTLSGLSGAPSESVLL